MKLYARAICFPKLFDFFLRALMCVCMCVPLLVYSNTIYDCELVGTFTHHRRMNDCNNRTSWRMVQEDANLQAGCYQESKTSEKI